jgi:hypothetical protein
MELASFKRDSTAIEEGRWVDGSEVPELGDMRVKVRGMSSQEARTRFDRKQRMVPRQDRHKDGQLKPAAVARVLREMITEWALVDVEGLVDNGKPVTIERLREMCHEDDMEPLTAVIMEAVAAVDATRADAGEAATGN